MDERITVIGAVGKGKMANPLWHPPHRDWADVFQDRCIDAIMIAVGALLVVGTVQRYWRHVIERVFG